MRVRCSAALTAALAVCAASRAAPAVSADRDGPSAVAPLYETATLAVSGEGAASYRIPALETLPDGTLIAAYDRRNDSRADLPGDIDVMVRTSTDNGRTWSVPKAVVDHDGGVGAGDPSLLVDDETGRVFLFHAYSPKGVGFGNSGPGNDHDSTGTLQADYSYSDDGGTTWRTRRITKDIKKPEWRGMFASSGTGIQLSNGVLVQQYAFRKAGGDTWAVSVHSDDHGKTWRAGEPVGPGMDENKTVELSDGRVMLNSRTSTGTTRRVAYSSDGGRSYSAPVRDDELIDPTNNASVIRYAQDAKGKAARRLLFSNTASRTTRERLTVRMSCDNGRTWPVAKVVAPGRAGYSTLVELRDGTFGLFYESGSVERMVFARFNGAWLGRGC